MVMTEEEWFCPIDDPPAASASDSQAGSDVYARRNPGIVDAVGPRWWLAPGRGLKAGPFADDARDQVRMRAYCPDQTPRRKRW